MEQVTEHSAGGLVLRRRDDSGLEVLLIRHSAHGGWGFPKGWIEPGEVPAQTAVREVEEESGVLGEIIDDLPSTHYGYVNRERQRVAKSVRWYLMRFAGMGEQTHAHEVSAVEWLPIESVHARLTFKNDKDLFAVALSRILTADL